MRSLHPELLPVAKQFLAHYSLPTDDIEDENIRLFAVMSANKEALAGLIGLQVFGTYGLLRSLAVAPAARGQHIGRLLVADLQDVARAEGLKALYLLTTTAADFFSGLGYLTIDRAVVPPEIQASKEFADLCPASAVVMMRAL